MKYISCSFVRHARKMMLHPWTIILISLMVSQPLFAAPQCRHFTFSGEVKGRSSFHRSMGMGLSFRVEPTTEEGGWAFEIGPTTPKKEEWDQYIYTLNPPWRGQHLTMLDTTYATLAQDVVAKQSIDFWFLLNRKDSSRASDAISQILWPSTDTAQDESLALLGSLPMGQGVFRITDSDVIPGTARPEDDPAHAFFGAVLRIVFTVEFVVPPDFKPANGLHFDLVACPKPDAWSKQWRQ